MKIKKVIAGLLVLCVFMFSGCSFSNMKNQDESYAYDDLKSNSQIQTYSEDEYLVLRDIFLDNYKIVIESIQKAVSGFNMSEDWWNNYKSLHANANSMVEAFLGNSEKVPSGCVIGFNNIKEEIEKHSIAMNKIEEAYGKSADEQAIIIAQGVKDMNSANLDWKNKVED